MYNDKKLPQIGATKTTKQRRPRDENTDMNTLPQISARDKISFGCIKGFLKLRIMNGRKKTHGITGKIESLTTERTATDENKEEEKAKVAGLVDSYYDPRPLANTSKKFLVKPETRRHRDSSQRKVYEPSTVDRDLKLSIYNIQSRSRSLNHNTPAVRDFSVPSIMKESTTELNPIRIQKLTGSH